MKSFFSSILAAALNAAAKGAATAGDSGADLKTVGIAAGASALAGVLGYILTHPFGAHPAVAAAVASVAPKSA